MLVILCQRIIYQEEKLTPKNMRTAHGRTDDVTHIHAALVQKRIHMKARNNGRVICV